MKIIRSKTAKVAVVTLFAGGMLINFGRYFPPIDAWSRAQVIKGKKKDIEQCESIMTEYYEKGTYPAEARSCVDRMRKIMDLGVQSYTRYPNNRAFQDYTYETARRMNTITNNAADKLRNDRHQ